MVVILLTTPLIVQGEQVKDFTLPSALDNSLIRLSDHSGKVVLINWWRTSCSICQRETPKLVALYKKYHDQDLEIIGISDDNTNTVTNIPAFLQRYSITWPVGLNDQGEFIREIRPLGSGSTPCNYLVSRSGEITFLGLMRNPTEDWQKIEQAVVKALDKPAPEVSIVNPREHEVAPPFALPALKGNSVKLGDFSGKPLVVNFFTSGTGSWAGTVFTKLHQDYSHRGLQVIGINLYSEDSQIKKYIETYAVKYPILRGDQKTQLAWIGSSEGWAVFFVTPDGKFLKKIINSINNGIEQAVFQKYAEYLLSISKSPTGKKLPPYLDVSSDSKHEEMPTDGRSFFDKRAAHRKFGS